MRSRTAAGLGRWALHAALALACAACPRGPATTGAPPPAPILVVGLDGFEWNVALPLLREGRLPRLAGLIERGVAGELETMKPNESPLLWTSIATGKHWTEHGIRGFVKDPRDTGGKRAVQYTSGDRRVKAYWNVLSDAGISSDTVGWWATWPAEEVLGMIVAPTWSPGTGVKYGWIAEGASDVVFPRELEGLVFDVVERHAERIDELKREIFGEVPGGLSRRGQRQWEESNWAFRTDSTNVEVLRRRIESGRASRVLAVYLGGADVTGHRFWAALHPEALGLEPDHEVVRAFGHVIPAYYEYVDRVIGELLSLLPAETTVLVISDHGMGASEHPEGELDPYGVTGNHADLDNPAFFVAAGTGIARRALPSPLAELERADLPHLGGIIDFCPTLLALCGVPYGEDMQGRPLAAILDPEFLAAHPIASVATHDDAEWLSKSRAAPEIDDPERREQLEQLGYLDAAPTPSEPTDER